MSANECDELRSRIVKIETAFAAFRELMAERDTRTERAIAKAEQATERRLEALNELREMTSDQAKTFARKDEMGIAFKAAEDRTTLMWATIDRQHKSFDDRLTDVAKALDRQQGRGIGTREVWGYLFIAVGFALTALAIHFK